MILPDNILSKMSEADRKELGKAGVTAAEAAAKATRRIERHEHDVFSNWLRLHKIPFIRSRTDKRPTIATGWPDFTILLNSRALCIEFKLLSGRLSPEQSDTIADLNRVHVPVFVLNTAAEAIATIRNQFPDHAVPRE